MGMTRVSRGAGLDELRLELVDEVYDATAAVDDGHPHLGENLLGRGDGRRTSYSCCSSSGAAWTSPTRESACQPIATTTAKHEQVSRERVPAYDLSDHLRQAIKAAPHNGLPIGLSYGPVHKYRNRGRVRSNRPGTEMFTRLNCIGKPAAL